MPTQSATIPYPSLVSAHPGSEGRIRELDGWRAISVLLVILHHVFTIQHPDLVHLYLAWHIVGLCGFLGVNTFFVISGFVICRLLIAEERKNGSVSLRRFYIRRVFRILPPLYLYMLCIAVLMLCGLIRDHAISLAVAASFLYDLSFMPGSWFFAHMWSLSVEEQFYLIFPTVWILAPARWRGRTFAGIFALCAAWIIALGISHAPNPAIDARTRAGFACICFGVLMAIYEPRVRHFAARTSGWIVLVLALVLLIHPVPHGKLNEALFSALFMPPAIGLSLIYSIEHEGWLKTWLCTKPLQAVGLTSYGIYLWQQLFTAPVAFYSGAGVIIPRLVPLLFGIIPLSYFLVEKPAMRLGKRLSNPARA
ncbi:MAG TPA: acyltransferase [Silvibacterium sp.]|nr:acyltransferase [Silvibacterium sp.]